MKNRQSILLKTSSKTDIQFGGGDYNITGLRSVSRKDITSFKQIKYRVEVAQVYTVGGGTYTPTADTAYSIQIGDVNRSDSGARESLYIYTVVTPNTAGLTAIGNAAAQREWIHAALVVKINNQTAQNRSVAVSLGTGTGFTVTDSGGYYPVRAQNQTKMRGPNFVGVRTNTDGTGFADTNITLTTAGVTSFGDGTKLATESPVVDFVYGGLISGNLIDPPLTTAGAVAVAGQKYDGFVISSLQKEQTPTITDRYTYIDRSQVVYVDNGTGTATTNLAGFIVFEKQMRKAMASFYKDDANAQIDFFDDQILFQGAAGAVPTTTGANKLISWGGAGWIYTAIGTQTITTPIGAATGLLLDQDLTDTEGAEYTPSLLTDCPKEFVVGKTAFGVYARMNAADWTDAAWLIGFRKKAAHTADFNDYTDLAAAGTLAANGDLITTQGILNNAATVSTSTAIVPVDAASVTVAVTVAVNGLVTIKVNGTAYPVYSTGTTALILDVDDIMIPFVRYANVSTGDPDLTLMHIVAVASDDFVS